jgi:hypothetical protein
MDHILAPQTNSPDHRLIDKYLMGELTHAERQTFEEHMFDCPACAERVKEDFDLISDLKVVLWEDREEFARQAISQSKKTVNSWRDWFRLPSLAPAFAAIALAIVVGYQNFVSIPGMLQTQVLDTTPIVATTRGAESQIAAVKPGAVFFPATFEVFSQAIYPGYVCEFLTSGKTVAASVDCGKHATAEFTLTLLLPAGKFPDGGYTMILRPATDRQTEISRYSFVVRKEDK